MDFFQEDSFFMPTFMCDDPPVWEISYSVLQKPGGGDDRVYLSSKKFPDLSGQVFAILDGHSGREASKYVQANLDELTERVDLYLKKYRINNPNIVKDIQDIVLQFLFELEQDFFDYIKSIYSTRGGTTIAMVIVIGDHIFGFNLGDSTVIIYNDTTGEGIDMAKHDLKEDGPEYVRLKELGVILESKPDISFEYPDIVRESSNNRAYNEKRSSIAMSGSFGDIEFPFLAKKPYMYHIRAVKGHNYTIMLYSDGLGDIFGSDPSTLVGISGELSSKYPSLRPAERLVLEARRCWSQTWNLEVQGPQGKFYQPQRVANMDDCSCIVLEL